MVMFLLLPNKNKMEHKENFAKGTCKKMCPESEIELREREGLLHEFEIIPNTRNDKRPKADKEKVVKCFRRSAAGQDMTCPEDLRTPEVLLQTVSYLLHDIISITHCDWIKVYDFISDRIRAVRQDMVIQNLSKPYCIALLQPIVRFYAYSAYKLCTEDISVFDSNTNNLHLQECLKMLLVIYDEYDILELRYNEMKCIEYDDWILQEFEGINEISKISPLKEAETIADLSKDTPVDINKIYSYVSSKNTPEISNDVECKPRNESKCISEEIIFESNNKTRFKGKNQNKGHFFTETNKEAEIISGRSEIEAIYILFNLGNITALMRVISLPKILKTSLVLNAFNISLNVLKGNWVRACRKIMDLPPLSAAVASLHLGKVRRDAVYKMSVAYNSKNIGFPLKILQKLLLYGSVEELMLNLDYYNIRHDFDLVYFSKNSFKYDLKVLASGYCTFVDNKLFKLPIPLIVLNGYL